MPAWLLPATTVVSSCTLYIHTSLLANKRIECLKVVLTVTWRRDKIARLQFIIYTSGLLSPERSAFRTLYVPWPGTGAKRVRLTEYIHAVTRLHSNKYIYHSNLAFYTACIRICTVKLDCNDIACEIVMGVCT